MERGSHTLEEILSQPQAWQQALEVLSDHMAQVEDLWKTGAYQRVLFTGCGSTYYLSIAAADLLRQLTAMETRAVPGSELWLGENIYQADGKTLLVAVSRSGETTETLRGVRRFLNDKGGDVLTLSCYPDMPLAKLGKLNLIFCAAQEESVAQTRAFSTLYLAVVYLVHVWSGQASQVKTMDRLPVVCQALFERYNNWAMTTAVADTVDRIYYLGSGARYGLACELNLKMKEMSLSHAEAFHFMEFRHGPQSMISPSTLVVGLLSEAHRTQEEAVLAEMKARGAVVVSLAEKDASVEFSSSVPESMRNVLYLPICQLFAYSRSMHKGLNPDAPNNLTAVVKLV
ncbi:MAG TPA: SIS domain-containing protein [Longilinea sp.]|nr:SIS domain-containing protein [Longilinea sp.]